MNTDWRLMKHQELTRRIIGVFFEVYNELGHGFLESVYVEALVVALRDAGLTVEREFPLTVRFGNRVVGEFRADLVGLLLNFGPRPGVKRLLFDNPLKALGRSSRAHVGRDRLAGVERSVPI
jgi:hypothetical protein